MENQELKDRIKILINIHSQGNVTAFARAVGVGRSTVYLYLDGRRLPDYETLQKIAHVTGCDMNWLITGQGVAPGEELQKRTPRAAESFAGYGVKTEQIDVDLLAEVLLAVEMQSRAQGVELTPNKQAEIIALLYDLFTSGQAKDEVIKRIPRLLQLVK